MFKAIARPALALLALAGLAAVAIAEPPAHKAPQPGTDVLGGPAVKQVAVPGERVDFGAGSGFKKDGGSKEIPHSIFMTAINESLGNNAPENVRLNAEQQAKIKTIDTEFTTSQREFFSKNRGEMSKFTGLRDKRAKGEVGAKGKPAPGGNDAQRQAMMEKMKELRDQAPKAADAHKQIWAVLNANQHAAAQTKLDAAKAVAKSKIDEKYVEREKKKFAGKLGKNPAEGGAGAGAATQGDVKKNGKRAAASNPNQPGEQANNTNDPAARERGARLAELISKLTPEQRELVTKRLEAAAAAKNNGQPANRPAGKQAAAQRKAKTTQQDAKPAPSMDQVEVPTPK